MALYALGVRTTGTASGAAAWEIRTTSTDRAYVREIGVFLSAATASIFGLGRPAAIGVTPTTPVTFLAQDAGAPTGTVTSALAWGTGPTVPTNFLRRAGLPGAVGNGIVWTFGPTDLVIPVSGSLVLWNLQLNAAFDAYAVIDE
jgi:hypothetical protein